MIRNGLMIVASSSMTSMISRRYLQSSMNHLMSWYDDEYASLSGSIQPNCVNLFLYSKMIAGSRPTIHCQGGVGEVCRSCEVIIEDWL